VEESLNIRNTLTVRYQAICWHQTTMV